MLLTTSLDGEASFSLLVVKYWINNNGEWFIKISTKFKANRVFPILVLDLARLDELV